MINSISNTSNNTTPSFIRVTNYTFFFIWLTVIYNSQGKTITYESGAYTAGLSKQANLPADATNVTMKVYMLTLTQWVQVYTLSLPRVNQLCFGIAGVPDNPIVGLIPCNSSSPYVTIGNLVLYNNINNSNKCKSPNKNSIPFPPPLLPNYQLNL